MALEDADDRAAFLDTDEFAEAGSYTLAAGGDPATVNGIYDGPHAAQNLGGGVELSASDPSFLCRSADLPSGSAKNDTLVVEAGTFLVKVLEPDGSGFTVIKLKQS